MFVNQEHHIIYNQSQSLLINLAMRQAFHVMQLSLVELAEWMRLEIESNPVLEIDLTKEEFKEPLEMFQPDTGGFRNQEQDIVEKKRQEQQQGRLVGSVSLYEYLMQQVPLNFEERIEIHLAELIIGHLNEKGFLDVPLEEVAPSIPLSLLQKVLQRVQCLDPPGIAARDVRETLLLQLENKGQRSSLAFQIVEQHFEALLHNKLPSIAQALQLSLSALNAIIDREIIPLDLYPGYRFHAPQMSAIVPDVLVCEIEGKWYIEINTALLPKFQICSCYAQAAFEARSQEAVYVRQKLASGLWLKRAVQKRNHTLQRIATLLLKKQSVFFEAGGSLVALTTKEMAQELGLHESTVARAVAHKFIACPQGVFSLRSFFKQGVVSPSGKKVSNQSLKDLLLRAVELEDKQTPLSDLQLSSQFRERGITCARRTISKYRSALNIAPASKRRRWA